MNATTILMSLIKWILTQKFGVVILIVVGVILLISLVRNILSGSFNVAKFAGGFNPFTGSVQGKLMYYVIFAILAFGLYHQLTRATTSYDTDYKNQIHHNQDVFIDQKVGATGCDVNLFFGLVKLGCNPKPLTKTVNNNYGDKNETNNSK
jgi:uncharacterized membrane protein